MPLTPVTLAAEKGPPSRFRRTWPAGAAVVSVGVIVRLVHWHFFNRDNPFALLPMVDAWAFHSQALEILDGKLIPGQVPIHGPLYPFFLAGTYALAGTRAHLAAVLAQHFLGVLLALLIFLVGRRFFGSAAGTAAGLLAAVYPVLIFYEGLLLMSSLVVLLDMAGLAALLVWRRHRRPRWLAAGGLCWGLSTLARPNALFPVFATALWLFLRRPPSALRRRLAEAALFLGPVVALVTPLLFFNHRLSGSFVLQSNLGLNVYLGNNPQANGTPYLRPGPAHENLTWEAPLRVGGDLASQNRWFLGQVVQFARSQPARFLALQAVKAYLLLSDREITDTYVYPFLRRYSPVLAYNPLGFGLIFGLAGAGAFLVWRRGRRWLLLPALFLVAYGSSVVLSVVSSRYRLSLVPPLLLLAGVGLAELWRAIRRSRTTDLRLALGVALLLTSVSLAGRGRAANSDAWEPWYLMGLIHKIRCEDVAAEQAFRQALAIHPDYTEASFQLGELLIRQGRLAEGGDLLDRALALVPCFYRARLVRGDLRKGHDPSGAAQDYLVAAHCNPLRPEALEALVALADQCEAAGHPDRARQLLAGVLVVRPNYGEALRRLKGLVPKGQPLGPG